MPEKAKIAALIVTALVMFSASVGNGPRLETAPVDYVDPMIGTGGVIHTFPGAVVPFGMVQLSPDTGGTHGLYLSSAWKWCAGYHYDDTTILGFSHVHRSGMGVGDWGDILFMPTVGKLRIKPGEEEAPQKGYRSRFSHEREQASPGYYSADLLDYGIKAELTATTRAGFHRYTFPETDAGHIIIDLGHGLGDTPLYSKVEIKGDNEIVGTRASTGRVPFQAVHFCARLQKPFRSFGVWNGGVKLPGLRKASGAKVGAWVDYETAPDEEVPVKVGISYTGPQQACENLEAELEGRDFDSVREGARRAWGRELEKISISPGKGHSAKEKEKWLTIFYSALYHSFLFPATFSDADGTYTVINNKPGRTNTADFTYYSDYSIWDTFRSEMPLLTLVQPERTEDMIKTIVRQYADSGRVPTPQQFGNYHTEGMVGDHTSCVILDAYLKGVDGFDVDTAYSGMRKNATEPGDNVIPCTGGGTGRYGLSWYKKYGYIPADFDISFESLFFIVAYVYNQGASRTLAYAYDDFCVAAMARELEKEDDFEMFRKRSLYYKNVFDPKTGFVRGKKLSGDWMHEDDFDPAAYYSYYTEGNAWQWTWSVFHDIKGLISDMGGNNAFNNKLDKLFSMEADSDKYEFFDPHVGGVIGQYSHGNEPSHHIAFLYNYSGKPWKTQEMAARINKKMHRTGPLGLAGNEDMGQLSSWYVFSSLGLYPFAPGIYMIGSPSFAGARLMLKNGVLEIKADNASLENVYIQSASLNGKELDRPWISHDEIAGGGLLYFEMGDTPNREWGASSPPPSMDGFFKLYDGMK